MEKKSPQEELEESKEVCLVCLIGYIILMVVSYIIKFHIGAVGALFILLIFIGIIYLIYEHIKTKKEARKMYLKIVHRYNKLYSKIYFNSKYKLFSKNFKEAKKAFKHRNYFKAYDYALKADKTFKKIKKIDMMQRSLKEIYEKTRTDEVYLHFNAIYKKAENDIKSGDIEEAEDSVSKAKEILKRIDLVKNTIEAFEDTFLTYMATRDKKPYKEIFEKYKISKNLFNKGRYEKAMKEIETTTDVFNETKILESELNEYKNIYKENINNRRYSSFCWLYDNSESKFYDGSWKKSKEYLERAKNIYYSIKDIEEKIESKKKAYLNQNNDKIRRLFLEAISALDSGRWEKACQYFEKAEEIYKYNKLINKYFMKYTQTKEDPRYKSFVYFYEKAGNFYDNQEYEQAFKYISKAEASYISIENEIKKKEISLGLHNNFADITPHEFEYFIAELFRNMGYKADTTPGSGDYGVDVVAEKDGEKIVIQVKKWKNNVPPKEVNNLLGAMVTYNADKAIFITTSDFSSNAREFTRMTEKIELWDGEKLKAMVRKYML